MADTEDSATATTTSNVGERLRVAREEKGLSLEDVATQTRIPLRHLEAIETGDWSRLPAPTYTIGFAKSYASAVGLDRDQVGDDVRTEIGGQRPATTTTETFEPADPARTMPRWLVITAIAAIILVVLMFTWLNSRSLDEPQPVAVEPVGETPAAGPAAAPPQPAPAAQGPVILTATEPVWLQVYERGGRTLFQGELAATQRYQVPATATEPLLRTGKPQALKISVGDQLAPPVGPPAQTVSDVSLRAPDLLGQGAQPGAQPTVPAPNAPPGVQNTAR